MVDGQIDPARLEGEALRRWYARPPREIEDGRQRAAAYAYDGFFGVVPSAEFERQPNTSFETTEIASLRKRWNKASDRPWRPGGAANKQAALARRESSSPDYRQAAASGSSGFWDYWGVRGCGSCHGYTPETLPPVRGHSPFPPGSSFRRGGSDGSSSSRPSWGGGPQCSQQFEADRKICQRARTPECWENSNRRLAHCSRTGEVSIPPLRYGRSGR